MKTIVLQEGFWASESEPQYPTPLSSNKEWEGKRDFVAALCCVQNSNTIESTQYRGWSTCRICKEHNGSSTNRFTMFGITWEWPSGFEHYVREHNVRPSWAFQSFILAATKELLK